MAYIISKSLSQHVLMVGSVFKTTIPGGGGIQSVIASYNEYIENMRHLATWKPTNKLNKAWFFFYHYLWLWFLLSFDRRIKIVHIHSADGPSLRRKLMIANVAKLMGKKVIIHMHSANLKDIYAGGDDKTKRKIREGLQMVDIVIVLSESWKDFFISIGIDKNKIIGLNNIITPPTENVLAKKMSVLGNRLPIKILFLGWLGKRKGIWDLLEVIIAHKDELYGKLILKFGGNDFEEEIRSLINREGIGNIAQFEGYVTGNNKKSLLEWSDIYILPSYNEGLPISILEALSYGMPIISTTVGGIPEVVKDKKNGLLITAGDKKQIWQSLKFFIENRDKIIPYGKESLKIVKLYTPNYVIHDLKVIYEKLLK